jgi:glutamine amidotransferase
LEAKITADRKEIEAARAVILPGVGAFGDAMQELLRLDLVGVLRERAGSGQPFLGVCLGLQLLMGTSEEFGDHDGLGMVPGSVVRFPTEGQQGERVKIPQVGWNRVAAVAPSSGTAWEKTLLRDVSPGEFMYFVHSYYVVPDDKNVIIGTTAYGGAEYCSALRVGNVFGLQFHPERSGPAGLQIYSNLAKVIEEG